VLDGLRSLPVEITSDLRPEHRSSIVSFTLGSAERDRNFVAAAKVAGVVVGKRGMGVRVAAHYWNSAEDAERLLEAVARFSR
jgi:selenocysteine lyase/cysteine desulfurase